MVAFLGVGVYFIGFRSFRHSVGLLLRCLWSVVVSRVRFGSPGAASVVPGFIRGPLAPSGSRSAFRSDALRGSCVDPLPLPGLPAVAALPGVVYGPLLAFILFRGFFFACGGFRRSVGFLRLRHLAAVPLLGLVSLYEFGRPLGVVCPSFFRLPFGILCGFFSCHGSKIPGAGRRSRLPFSASGVVLICLYNLPAFV